MDDLSCLVQVFSENPGLTGLRLTLGQAVRINDQMHGSNPRIHITRDMDLLLFDLPVVWVDDEADSVLGEGAGGTSWTT